MKITHNATFLGLIAAVLAALVPVTASAQGIRVVADTITDNATSDSLYFTLGGTSSFQSSINVPSIHPSNSDYWSMARGTSVRGVTLHESYLGNSQRSVLAIAARAHRSCNWLCVLGDIFHAGETLVLGVASFLTLDPSLAVATVGSLASTIDAFANSFQGDATIGAFGIYAANSNGFLSSSFVPSSTSRLISQNGNSYVLALTNSGYSYTITLHVEQFHGAPLRSVNSNLCIDVPNASLADGVQIQQYFCNGQRNQSWLQLRPSNTLSAVLVNENSGKCMDVRPNASGNFVADGNAIQQYTCHFGPNQQWMVFPWFSGGTVVSAFVNTNSSKCIDVPSRA